MLLLQSILSVLAQPARYCVSANTDDATLVEAFADTAYDELSIVRNNFNLELEDFTIPRARRNIVIGVMCRLSIMMQVCMILGIISNALDEDSHSINPSAEVTEVFEFSLIYIPARKRTVRSAVISD